MKVLFCKRRKYRVRSEEKSNCKAASDRSLLGKVGILALSNLALQILWFFYRSMLTRLAGSEALGLQSLVMQIYSIIVSVCITGLDVAIVALGAKLKSGCGGSALSESAAYRKLFSNAFKLFVILFAFAAIPVFALRKGIAGSLIGDAGSEICIMIVLLCIFLTGIEHILKSIHISAGMVRRPAVSELIEQSIRFILVYIALKHLVLIVNAQKVSVIMLCMLLSEFFSISFMYSSFRRKFPERRMISGDIENMALISLRSVSRILIPASATAFSSTVISVAASLLLPSRLMQAGYTRAQALSSIGILGAAAVPLVMLPLSFVSAMATVLLPEVSASCASENEGRVRRLLKGSCTAAALTFILFNLPILRFAGNISWAVFGVEPSKTCFILLTVKTAIIYFQVIATSVLNGMMKQKTVLLLTVTGEAVQLLLMYFMSADRSMHIYGYLIAMCIGEGIRLILSLIFLARLIRHKKDRRKQVLRSDAARH